MVNFQQYFGGSKKLLIPPQIFLEVKGWVYKIFVSSLEFFFKFQGGYTNIFYTPSPLPLGIFQVGAIDNFFTPPNIVEN